MVYRPGLFRTRESSLRPFIVWQAGLGRYHVEVVGRGKPRVRVFRGQVPGTGFQIPGTWHLGPGTRYRISAEGRTPSTEDRARPPENTHTGLARFLSGGPGMKGWLLSVLVVGTALGCARSDSRARMELARRGIPFTPAAFLGKVGSGDVEAVCLFLRAGMSPTVRNPYGLDALAVAIVMNQPAVLDVLLEAGADPNAPDPSGMTALHWASDRCRPEAARRLIEAGADVQALDRDRWTPLHWAANRGCGAVVLLLLEAGADPRQPDADGFTAAAYAATAGYADIARLLRHAEQRQP
jgi:hypothetical protein